MNATRFAFCLLLHWVPTVSGVQLIISLSVSARFDKALISPYIFEQFKFCSISTYKIPQFSESGKGEAEIIRPLSQLHFGGEDIAFLADIPLYKLPLAFCKNALMHLNSIILGMLVPFLGRR